jgi:GNAT superfamily N-acetyltransferase
MSDVVIGDDAGTALADAGTFLRSDPVRNNLVLTLLDTRVAHPEPGRYAWVIDGGKVVGVGFQSPLAFQAVLTAMPTHAIGTFVDRLAGAWPDIPGVFGPADTVSRFAGRWAETLRVGATPVEGQRLYGLDSLHAPTGVPGELRAATDDDTELILSWVQGFERDTGSSVATAESIRRRIGAGRIWIWDDRAPVAMATYTPVLAGVSRVGLVYTPPERRRRGYGAACTAAVTQQALDAGAERCVLYTQLHNPQSNAIYRRLGYRPVCEHLRYQFATGPGAVTAP